MDDAPSRVDVHRVSAQLVRADAGPEQVVTLMGTEDELVVDRTSVAVRA